ncbi:TetR/AcrR family transcriptional regulator [Mycobacterium sp. 1081908.1]|uniref:TetR/AcrR family transcriptional regulator n=1 Tax=Mycobacterium sp. 1081908.1 TaxID=1834066 RepID=UPI0018D3C150|nr:TetR/AcrR family transcriptional regulator [Mycobacterium sp. 1081908.1]
MKPAEPVTPKGRRTRESLLDAGEAVAAAEGLAGVTIAAVTKHAGVAKGTFYVYFSDRDVFVDALHQRFYEQVNDAVANAVAGLEPGGELLAAAAEAYLDVCLAHRAMKALVFDTRALGHLTTTMEQRHELFAKLAEPGLRSAGVPAPRVAARLFVALTSETALIELEAGKRVSGARAILRAFIASL